MASSTIAKSGRKRSSKPGSAKPAKSRRVKASGLQARALSWARRLLFWGSVLIFILWVGAWLVLSGVAERSIDSARNSFHEFTAKQGLILENMIVEGRVHTDPALLKGLSGMEKGDSLLAFDPREAQIRIENLSWVKTASVTRHFPGTIHIVLQERKPLARWQNEQGAVLIDAEGVTLTDTGLSRFSDLPLVRGKGAEKQAPAFLSLLKAEPILEERLKEAVWIGERRWDLVFERNITAKLPADDPVLALRRLAKAQEEESLLDKNVSMIELREPDRLIIRMKQGAVRIE